MVAKTETRPAKTRAANASGGGENFAAATRSSGILPPPSRWRVAQSLLSQRPVLRDPRRERGRVAVPDSEKAGTCTKDGKCRVFLHSNLGIFRPVVKGSVCSL